MSTSPTIISFTSGRFAVINQHEQFDYDPAAMKDAIAQLRAILSSALDPIVTIDLSGTIHTVSNSIERVFGWTPRELLGRNIKVLMPSPHHESHDAYLANYRRTGVTNILNRTREFHAMRKDGTQFPIELSVARVEVPGRAEPLFTGIIHDISERRALEEELQKHRQHLEELVESRTRELAQTHEQLRTADRLASIGTLAAGLGHDMNNVLLPIRARLDSLDAAELPAKSREQFQAVRRSIAYLQQLSDGLHMLSLDPDDAQATGNATSLSEWWNQVGSLLIKPLPKRVAFHCDLPDALPAVAIAPHRLTQAVLNLVVNAGEAITGEGMVRVWAKVAADSRFIQLGVTDTGEGMSADVKRHALDPFFTTKKRGLGTGLGLSLVHGVVQEAGGRMEIESSPGNGTTVLLTLPVYRPLTADNAVRGAAIIAIRDRRAASFSAALLEAAGWHVEYLKADLSSLKSRHVQLLVVDPVSASGDGVMKFAAQHPHAGIVVFGTTEGCRDVLASPRLSFISDPFDFEEIRRVLGEAIELSASR